MTSCRTETEIVSWTQKAWPFNCCCNHQWHRRLSACVMAHDGHF